VRRKVPRERIFHAANGVDTGEFRPRVPDADLRRMHGLEGNVVIGYVGFFFAYEGVDVLLRAFAQLADLPRLRLVLVGRGDEESALRALMARLGLASRVLFAGAVPHADVRRWYSVCDVLVYPRRRTESTALVTPLKPLEAMAMAKPVVAAAVGGLQELIRNGETGLLCQPESSAAFAAALGGLAASSQRRATLGGNARRFVCAERDWTHLAPRYDAIYRGVLSQRASSPDCCNRG
jgi:glycosyltransferase involved in cell wall biosynthesis